MDVGVRVLVRVELALHHLPVVRVLIPAPRPLVVEDVDELLRGDGIDLLLNGQ